jgi:hypothetical protein
MPMNDAIERPFRSTPDPSPATAAWYFFDPPFRVTSPNRWKILFRTSRIAALANVGIGVIAFRELNALSLSREENFRRYLWRYRSPPRNVSRHSAHNVEL